MVCLPSSDVPGKCADETDSPPRGPLLPNHEFFRQRPVRRRRRVPKITVHPSDAQPHDNVEPETRKLKERDQKAIYHNPAWDLLDSHGNVDVHKRKP